MTHYTCRKVVFLKNCGVSIFFKKFFRVLIVAAITSQNYMTKYNLLSHEKDVWKTHKWNFCCIVENFWGKKLFFNVREVFYKSKQRYFVWDAQKCCHTQEKAPLEGDSLDESPAGCYRLENRSNQFMRMYLPLSNGAYAWSLTHFSWKIFAS